MNKIKNNYIYFFILVQPLIDVFVFYLYKTSGVLSGSVIRGFFFLILLVLTVLKGGLTGFKSFKNYLFFALIYYLLHFIYSTTLMNIYLIDSIYFLKFIYFPIILIVFYINTQYDTQKIETSLNIAIIIIFSVFAFATATGTYVVTYESTGVGNSGWFYSANEISSIISLLFPYTFFSFVINRKIIGGTLALLLIFPSIVLGVKSTLLSIIISIGFYILLLFVKRFRKSLNDFDRLVLKCIPVLFVVFAFILIRSEMLRVTVDRFMNIYIDQNFLTKLLSGRNLRLYEPFLLLYQHQPLSYFFGLDSLSILIEMDLFDIFFKFGLIGLILLFTPFLKIWISNKQHLRINYDFLNSLKYSAPVVLSLLISFFSGHIIASPAVSYYVALFFVLYIKNNKGEYYD